MKNLKIEVVRYNPEVDTDRIAHSMKCLMTQLPHYWMRGLHQRQPGTGPELPLVLPYGICGSCGMMVNNVPKLACKTSCVITPTV